MLTLPGVGGLQAAAGAFLDRGEVSDQEQFVSDFCKLTNEQKSSAVRQPCDGDCGKGAQPQHTCLTEAWSWLAFVFWRRWMEQTLPSHGSHLLAPIHGPGA